MDLAERIASGRCALVTSELQRGVVGDLSALSELAAAAAPTLPRIATLARAARAAGVPVIHCTAERRPDGRGANANARIFGYMARAPHPLHPGSAAAELVPELEAEDGDLVFARLHGLSPFHGTELDWVLRNLGVSTLVVTGVSLNVAIQNLTYDAVNASYQVVIPRDAVAGFPPEYGEAVLAHSLGAVGTLTSSQELVEAWS